MGTIDPIVDRLDLILEELRKQSGTNLRAQPQSFDERESAEHVITSYQWIAAQYKLNFTLGMRVLYCDPDGGTHELTVVAQNPAYSKYVRCIDKKGIRHDIHPQDLRKL